MNRMELLAPAGDRDALVAAVQNGADAVYLGTGAFNARRNAANFDGAALDDVTVAGWHIVAENVQVNSSLDNISVALGYSGIETSEYSKTADEGMTFCMIKLLIEKQGSKETIDWENMLLTDGDGNEYHRIADEFILDLGMKRMPGTKLNFGSNEGWIAYQIPVGAGGLTLSYAFESETYSLALGI